MLSLAWSNLTHHKLRAGLSALAVGMGLALFLVSKGLAHGSISEVADRMESVQAELLILPGQENMIFSGGAIFPEAYRDELAGVRDDSGPLAAEVIPAFWGQIRMGGQQQRLFGVDPNQMDLFLGPRKVRVGKAFDQAHQFAARIAQLRVETGRRNVSNEAGPHLDEGLELIIDERLAKVGSDGQPYRVGDTVQLMGRELRIVGIVETGVAGRVFAPLQTLQHMFNSGQPWATMFFVKLRDGADISAAANRFADVLGDSVRVQPTRDYEDRLQQELSKVYMYINVTNTLALVVCFMFILLTMYTFVLERTREIGILKSLGVSRRGLMLLSITEALLISGAGVAIAITLAFVAQAIIAAKAPLLTTELPPDLLASAVAIGLLGGIGSALYPGWQAARLQPVEALNYE